MEMFQLFEKYYVLVLIKEVDLNRLTKQTHWPYKYFQHGILSNKHWYHLWRIYPSANLLKSLQISIDDENKFCQ